MTLDDVRRIADEVAKGEDPNLEVVAAMAAGGEAARYAEVLLTLHGCRREPCQILMGISRDASEAEFRVSIRRRLQEHFADHPANGRSAGDSS